MGSSHKTIEMEGSFCLFILGVSLSSASLQVQGRNQLDRGGRQVNTDAAGVDFTGCGTDPDTGFCCVEKEETVSSLEKEPILECTHKDVEQCHYSYVTQFTPSQEEVCEEHFEKQCSITFKQQAYNETEKKCYKPVENCGAGCTFEEGPEECHEKVLVSLVDVPEEQCDLNPQKTCRFITKLVPKLKPSHECTIVPQEVCNLKFSQPRQVPKPLQPRWCLDPTPASPGENYSEEDALGEPISQYNQN